MYVIVCCTVNFVHYLLLLNFFCTYIVGLTMFVILYPHKCGNYINIKDSITVTPPQMLGCTISVQKLAFTFGVEQRPV